MHVLVLGGTRFIGRHIVEALVDGGHAVSVLTRGQSPDELPASVDRLRGDRSAGAGGIAALQGRSWDACVDVSGYTPTQVGASAALLRDRVGRYTFISTVSVYAESTALPVLETHPLMPAAPEDQTEVTNTSYGPLKVTCERVVQTMFGEQATILRPQIVAGPHDPTGRHTYWVQRSMQGGEVLAPGDGTDHVQVVDARDIARFTRGVLEHDTGGIFNMAGPRLTWTAFMHALGVDHPVWMSTAELAEAELSITQLPLFVPDTSPHAGIMHVSNALAVSAGFGATDARATVADVRDWLRAHPFTPALSPERERESIARARRS